MLFEFVVKSAATDSEFLGGLFLVSFRGSKGHEHKFFFNSVKRHPRMNRKMLDCGIGFRGSSNSQWEEIRSQLFSLSHEYGALDNIL